ncbi:hypothetical protein Pdw03_6442 [Penicillium digitatum]|uniref:Uncharacterized protein n=1 Tax=Penicillium digitatum TaxID=36651 RepID=A0A7T7BJX8_PENDI|nr:hypothetical protein PDIDSM_5690 [Penicillium digitatum]QQK42541.1 hypothetical protein Pdw03_6442 [Penicillium digitatum]
MPLSFSTVNLDVQSFHLPRAMIPQYLSFDESHPSSVLLHARLSKMTTSASSIAELKLSGLLPILTSESNFVSWLTVIICALDTREPHFFEILIGKALQESIVH